MFFFSQKRDYLSRASQRQEAWLKSGLMLQHDRCKIVQWPADWCHVRNYWTYPFFIHYLGRVVTALGMIFLECRQEKHILKKHEDSILISCNINAGHSGKHSVLVSCLFLVLMAAFLVHQTAPERSTPVVCHSFTTSEQFAMHSLTPDDLSDIRRR